MKISAGTLLAAFETITTLFMTLFSPSSNDYNSVNRRFLFTMVNQSPFEFHLEQTKNWYGNIDAPVRVLESGSKNEMGVLQVRGYKQGNTATGVTYTFCFRIVTEMGNLNQWLNIYLQVGFTANNYFGWFISDTPQCLEPSMWYNNIHFDREKRDCSDRVLNKGDTFRLQATCFGLLDIKMFTDNMSWSTPSMQITWLA